MPSFDAGTTAPARRAGGRSVGHGVSIRLAASPPGERSAARTSSTGTAFSARRPADRGLAGKSRSVRSPGRQQCVLDLGLEARVAGHLEGMKKTGLWLRHDVPPSFYCSSFFQCGEERRAYNFVSAAPLIKGLIASQAIYRKQMALPRPQCKNSHISEQQSGASSSAVRPFLKGGKDRAVQGSRAETVSRRQFFITWIRSGNRSAGAGYYRDHQRPL
jgi:hypothetical protein